MLLALLNIASADPSVFDITDYESYRTDPDDDAPVIRAAIAAANSYVSSTGIPATVEIPEGTYYLDANPNNTSNHLYISNANDLTIRGVPTATLVMKSWNSSGIIIGESKGITLEDLVIEYDPLPHTHGSITSVDTTNNYIYLDIASGMPLPTAAPFQSGIVWGYVYDNGTLNIDTVEHRIVNPTLISGQNYRLTSLETVTNDLVGQSLILSPRGATSATAVFVKNAQYYEDPSSPGEQINSATIDNVTIHSSPTTGFQMQGNKGMVTVQNCTIVPKSGQILSTNADGIHAKWCREPINAINCDFSGMGDDGINYSGTYQNIIEQTSATVIYVVRNEYYTAGDRIEIHNPETGEVIASPTITAASNATANGQNATKLTLDTSIQTLSTVVSPVSGRSKPDWCTDIEICAPGSQILNNNFWNHRGRGIMLHSDNTLVEGNIFAQLRGPGVVIGPDYSWAESASGSGSIIRNNTFDNISRSNILISTSGTSINETHYATKDILIEGNLFTNYGLPSYTGRGYVGEVFYSGKSKDITFSRNIIGSRHPSGAVVDPVKINRSDNVALLDNDFYGASSLDDWLTTQVDVTKLHITETVFSDNIEYTTETEIDDAWPLLDTLGGNPLRLGVNTNISDDQPYIMIGTAVASRDLDFEVSNDWLLAFDMYHSDPNRRGIVGLMDSSLQHGYMLMWSSGASGSDGTVYIKKFDLTSSLDDWYVTGTTLDSGNSGHTATSVPLAHLELTWDASTGSLVAYVDGVEVASAIDTAFNSFSKIVISGAGSGAAGDATYIDNLHVSTLDTFKEPMSYSSESALDSAWSVVHSLEENTLTLGTDSNVSAEQPYAIVGNAVLKRDLEIPLQTDWILSFDMIHTQVSRHGWVGLLDASGQYGYIAYWDSGSNIGVNGTVSIRKIDLTSELNTWYETGSQLDDSDSGHQNTTTPFAEIELHWEADTGSLKLYVDGSLKASAADTEFKSYSRVYMSGDRQGNPNAGVYIDNIEITTLP